MTRASLPWPPIVYWLHAPVSSGLGEMPLTERNREPISVKKNTFYHPCFCTPPLFLPTNPCLWRAAPCAQLAVPATRSPLPPLLLLKAHIQPLLRSRRLHLWNISPISPFFPEASTVWLQPTAFQPCLPPLVPALQTVCTWAFSWILPLCLVPLSLKALSPLPPCLEEFLLLSSSDSPLWEASPAPLSCRLLELPCSLRTSSATVMVRITLQRSFW